jgi:uncharacterized membrane protein YfcA
MEFYTFLGYFFALFVGITLGVFGSGGSILAVPILVYVFGIASDLATGYSLFIVGITSLVGGIHKINEKLVDFKKVFLFGIPTVITVFLTRKFGVPAIPFEIHFYDFAIKKTLLIMIVFGVFMIFSAIKMLKPTKEVNSFKDYQINYLIIIILGIFVGVVAGFVGAGGGFLIVPILIYYLNTPLKIAIGTSLVIVSIQSSIGFLGDFFVNRASYNWHLLIIFSICSLLGIWIGNFIIMKIKAEKLKYVFAVFILTMGLFILVKELLLSK